MCTIDSTEARYNKKDKTRSLFLKKMVKMANLAKDKNQISNAKFLTGNPSFLTPFKEAETVHQYLTWFAPQN